MSDTPSVNPVGSDQSVQNAVSADQAAQSSTGESITGATTFSSIGDFRNRAPELYDRFMRTIADSIVKDMKRGQERVKKAMKKIREG